MTRELNRRSFMKATAATAGAATVGTISSTAPRYSPIGRADAVAPIVLGAAFAAGIASEWLLREAGVIAEDAPPDGLTAATFKEQAYQTAKTRQSTNYSTFIDNENIAVGVEHAAYGDAKIAAIEALNDQLTQSEVQAAAEAAIDGYETTVKKNLLKGWNETYHEVQNMMRTAADHPDVTRPDIFPTDYGSYEDITNWVYDENQVLTMPDGTDFTLYQYMVDRGSNSQWHKYDPLDVYRNNIRTDTDPSLLNVANPNGTNVQIMEFDKWNSIWTTIDTAFTTVRDGIVMWVDTVYGDVQSGELDTAQLLTPRELAEMTADDEEFSQAISDLMALNMSVDLQREAEVYIPSVGATIYGRLAVTDDVVVEVGSIDPSVRAEDYYITYNIADGQGVWTDYQTGVDGGIVTFTSEPFGESVFTIETSAGETAEVSTADFADQGDGTWTVDVSAQLENAITEVSSVEYIADVEGDKYETILLDEPFEIMDFKDEEGTSYDTTEFTQSEPQDDTNYITEEEWMVMLDNQEALIEKYEESQESDGGGGGGITVDADGLLDFEIAGVPAIGWIIGALGLGAASKL